MPTCPHQRGHLLSGRAAAQSVQLFWKTPPRKHLPANNIPESSYGKHISPKRVHRIHDFGHFRLCHLCIWLPQRRRPLHWSSQLWSSSLAHIPMQPQTRVNRSRKMQLGMVAGWAAEVEAGAEGRRGAEYGGAASRGYGKVAAVCGLTGRRWSTAAAAAGRGAGRSLPIGGGMGRGPP